MGDVALASGREGAELRDHHDGAERIMRGVAQPHAGGVEPRELAGMARRGDYGPSSSEGTGMRLVAGIKTN